MGASYSLVLCFCIYYHTMKYYLLLSMLCTLTYFIDGLEDGCVDIVEYTPLNYHPVMRDFCTFRCKKVCEKKSKELCQSVPVTSCEVEGYKDCQSVPIEEKVRDDISVSTVFVPQECIDGTPGIIKETKLIPQCKNETKKKCDSKYFYTDYTGRNYTLKDVNCKNVTWEHCDLKEVEIEEKVPTFDCFPGKEIAYEALVHQEKTIKTYKTHCKAKAVPVCTTRQEEQCLEVEWQHCQDQVVETCNSFRFMMPYQDQDHTVTCPLKP